MGVKNWNEIAGGVQSGSDFYDAMARKRFAFDENNRANAGAARSDEELALQKQKFSQDIKHDEAVLEIERQKVGLTEQANKLKALGMLNKQAGVQAEQESAAYRIAHSTADPRDAYAGDVNATIEPAFRATMPFAMGGALAAATAMGADKLLDQMSPTRAAAAIASAARVRASRIASKLSGPALQAFLTGLHTEAKDQTNSALARKVGDAVSNAQDQGLFSTGEQTEGPDGKAQQDTGVHDMLLTLTAANPVEGYKQLTKLLQAGAKKRSWLGYYQSNVLRSQAQVDQAMESGYMSPQQGSDLHEELEQMRSSTDQKTFDAHMKEFDSLLKGSRKVNSFRITTGHGTITIEDPKHELDPGKITTEHGESMLGGAANAIISGAPTGSLDLETSGLPDKGKIALAMMHARTQAAQMRGVRRHPALALKEASEALSKFKDQKAALADVQSALAEAGVVTDITSPEGRLLVHMARNHMTTEQIDGAIVEPGFELAVRAMEADSSLSAKAAIEKIQKELQQQNQVRMLPPPISKGPSKGASDTLARLPGGKAIPNQYAQAAAAADDEEEADDNADEEADE